MKKRFSVFGFLCVFFCASLCYGEQPQRLVPPEVYVGDHAEIFLALQGDFDFLSASNSKNGEIEISANNFDFSSIENSVTLLSARILKSNDEYFLALKIIPWKSGRIEFPKFDLFDLLGADEEKRRGYAWPILIEPIEISSIVEKSGKTEMQPPLPPFLIPGTTYIVFAAVILLIIVLALLVRALFKLNEIRRWVENMRMAWRHKKNAKIAVKKIKRLMRSQVDDIEFSASLQNIARGYLEFRFDYPFASVTSRDVRRAFEEICVGDMPPFVDSGVEKLTAMFIRTDYVRYAQGSVGFVLYPSEEKHGAISLSLSTEERKSLAKMFVIALNIFERGEDFAEENAEALYAV